MKNSLCALLLVLAVTASNIAWSETFEISVTIPKIAFLDAPTPQAGNAGLKQLAQTQQLVRNNKTVTVTSVVVR